jgi:transposase-like protein
MKQEGPPTKQGMVKKSGKRYRRWSWEEKHRVVDRMKNCSSEQLARELEIHKRQLYEWRDQLRRHRGEPPIVYIQR